MGRFKLMTGQHIAADETQEPVVSKNPFTGAESKRYPSRTYNAGEVVESEQNLEERFGSEKFRRLGDKKKKTPIMPAEVDPALMGVNPGGQVSTGHQMTSPAPDGRMVSGPADEATLERVKEANKESMKSSQEKANKAAKEKGKVEEEEEDFETEEEEEYATPDEEEEEDDEDEDEPAKKPKVDLQGMTVKELKAYASKNKINIAGSNNKDQIIRIIKREEAKK